MNLIYRVDAYLNGKDKLPEVAGRTGCFKTADHTAKGIAAEGYHATLVNIESANRTPYAPAPAVVRCRKTT